MVGGKGRDQRPEALREIEPRSFSLLLLFSCFFFPGQSTSSPSLSLVGRARGSFSFFPSLFCWQQPPPPTPSRFYTGEPIQSSVSEERGWF